MCSLCSRNFKTERGLKQHFNSCQKKNAEFMENTYKLPILRNIQNQPKIWGPHTKDDMNLIMNATYDEVVHWRRNLFLLPSGAAGKAYIRDTTRLLEAWVNSSELFQDIAIKTVMIMPSLLLQKLSYKSKAKKHQLCLQRRLNSWEKGEFDVLMKEARTIQSKLTTGSKSKPTEYLAKTFAKHMLKGKINSALRLLEEAESGGILPLTTKTLEELQLKHPKATPSNESVVVKGEVSFVDPAMFNNIDESSISKAALKTKGSAGPSGLDSDVWRRILVSKNFGNCSKDLRSTLANMARKLCIEEVTLREGEVSRVLNVTLLVV